MIHYYVRSPLGTRMWHADDAIHATEQHHDSFPQEPVISVKADKRCPHPDHPEECDQ